MPRRRLALTALTTAIVVVIALTATGVVIGAKVLAAGTASTLTTTSSAGPANTLTVVGEGTANATPDTATFSLGASVTSPSVGESLAVDNTRMQSLLNALRGQGVQDKDIQTTTVSVSPQTCCGGGGPITGYNVSNSVNVTVHNLQNVGPVIAAAVGAVGNEITIGGVSLSVANLGSAVSAARSAAMTDANSRAKTWASLAGRTLGRILSVSEVVNGQSPSQGGCGGAGCGGAGGLPIAAGQTEFSVSVTVTYELD